MNLFPRRLAALGFALLTASLATVRADESPIEIAAILSLTGTYAQVGVMEALSIKTEVKIANENGGVNGHALSLHLFDDQSNTGRAYMLADQIVKANTASAVVGGSTTSTCDAIHLATVKKNVVQYCLSGGQATGATYFSSFAKPQRIFGDLPAAFFAEHRLKRIAVILPDNHAGKVYLQALEPALQAQERELIFTAAVATANDAIDATRKALRLRPDVIYVGGDSDIEAATLSTVRSRHKRTTIWLADPAHGGQTASDFAGVLPRGPVYSAGDNITVAQQLPDSDPQRPELVAFAKTFSQQNSGLAPNTYAVVAADATRFIIAGLRTDGGVGGLALAKAMASVPMTVGLYSTYNFSPERHNGAELAGTIVRLHGDGNLKYVENLQPTETIASTVVTPLETASAAAPKKTVYHNESIDPPAAAAATVDGAPTDPSLADPAANAPVVSAPIENTAPAVPVDNAAAAAATAAPAALKASDAASAPAIGTPVVPGVPTGIPITTQATTDADPQASNDTAPQATTGADPQPAATAMPVETE